MTKPFQGALFHKFRDQIMGVILDQDPGPGKSQLEKAQTRKDKPNKGKGFVFRFCPANMAAPQQCVWRN